MEEFCHVRGKEDYTGKISRMAKNQSSQMLSIYGNIQLMTLMYWMAYE